MALGMEVGLGPGDFVFDGDPATPRTEGTLTTTQFLTHVQRRNQEFYLGGGAEVHGERGARGYNGGLGQSPQWGPGAEPLVRGKLSAFSWMYVSRFRQISTFLMFGIKRRKMIFKHRRTTNIRAVMLSLALVLGCP